MAAALWVALVAPAAAEPPRLVALEPAIAPPSRALTLALVGTGFAPGAEVRIESATPGRFVAYASRRVSAERVEVDLPLGFGARPERRAVLLRNPDGEESGRLELRIDDAIEAVPLGPGPEPERLEVPALVPERPRIAELRPALAPAGLPFVLEIHGSGFRPDSRVLITVNRNAGTSGLPEYGQRAMAAIYVDSSLLEVELERGFYPIPGARDVVVENPEGAASAPAILRIRSEKEQP
jgi:hypothetical protein